MAVSADYEAWLNSEGISVDRLWGSTRQQTSIAVFNRYDSTYSWTPAVGDGSQPYRTADKFPIWFYDDEGEINDFIMQKSATVLNYGMSQRFAVRHGAPTQDVTAAQVQNFGVQIKDRIQRQYASASWIRERVGAHATTTSTTSTTTTTSTTQTTIPEVPSPPYYGPNENLVRFMVDIPGYEKTRVGTEACLRVCQMGAKYTKLPVEGSRSVVIEIYVQADEQDAIKWMRDKEFANNTESTLWKSTIFKAYPASIKKHEFTISDRKEEDIFLRVAMGNLGVFSKFSQSGTKYATLTPLDEAQVWVDEVTGPIIDAFEGKV
jgi:hypothetical protein